LELVRLTNAEASCCGAALVAASIASSYLDADCSEKEQLVLSFQSQELSSLHQANVSAVVTQLGQVEQQCSPDF